MAHGLIVQDDAGSVVDANSYVTEVFFDDYHHDRGVSDVVNAVFEEDAIKAALILATDYLDARYRYIGTRRSAAQVTDWPRFDAEDADEYLITGIPHQIKEACAELALAELQAAGSLFPVVPVDPSGQAIKKTSSKLDVLETSIEYFGGDNASQAVRPPVFHTADWRLKKSGLVQSNRRIARG